VHDEPPVLDVMTPHSADVATADMVA